MAMRVFESHKSGAGVVIAVFEEGVQTICDGIRGDLRPFASMRPAPGAKPDWGYWDEVKLLTRKGWKEV